jgi:hypothetical protein
LLKLSWLNGSQGEQAQESQPQIPYSPASATTRSKPQALQLSQHMQQALQNISDPELRRSL